jgi:hypothetical protein
VESPKNIEVAIIRNDAKNMVTYLEDKAIEELVDSLEKLAKEKEEKK